MDAIAGIKYQTGPLFFKMQRHQAKLFVNEMRKGTSVKAIVDCLGNAANRSERERNRYFIIIYFMRFFMTPGEIQAFDSEFLYHPILAKLF